MAQHIYIHIPFCVRKCPYCDFYSESVGRCPESFFENYYEALLSEINLSNYPINQISSGNDEAEDGRDVPTIYFGGGTPSIFPTSYLISILGRLREKFGIPTEAETTIEVNPAVTSYQQLCELKEGGFNRLSIGVQSLHDDVLKTLGRLHDSKLAIETIENAKKAGFENISADLMLGIPGQTTKMLLDDANCLFDSGIKHLGMYSLMLEEGTAFFEKYSRTIESLVPQELDREMYHELRNLSLARGYVPYEISNCAIQGYESRHNLSYWKGLEYLAFGAGSHGYINSVRFSHDNDVETYCKFFHNNESASISQLIIVEETLDAEAKMNEYSMLMLRTSLGINLFDFERRFKVSFLKRYADVVKRNVSNGLLVVTDTNIFLSEKGLDIADIVFEEFV